MAEGKRIRLKLAMNDGFEPQVVTALAFGAVAVHPRRQWKDFSVTCISNGKCVPMAFYDKAMAVEFAVAVGDMDWHPDDTGKPVDRDKIKAAYAVAHTDYANRMLRGK